MIRPLARLRYLWRRRRCEPRHAFSMTRDVAPGSERDVMMQGSLMVLRVNRDPWMGYGAQTLMVSEMGVDSRAGERAVAVARFSHRPGGWNRLLLGDGRLVAPDDPGDLYPMADFRECFPDRDWREV